MKLKSVALDITYKCNFRCKHCYNSSGEHKMKKSELSDQELKIIVSQLCAYYPESICMCGGETLLRSDLICNLAEIIKSYSKGISVNMVTNGYLLTTEKVKKLKQSGVDHIQISLDGIKPSSHNWLRNKENSFEFAVQAMDYVKKENMILGVACAPSKINYDEIPDLIQFCYERKVDTLRFQPLMIMGRGSSLKKYELTQLEYYKLSEYINRLSKENKYPNMSIEWGDPLEHLGLIASGNQEYINWTINAYGELMFSPYIPVIIGDLKKYTVSDYVNAGIIEVEKDSFIKKCSSLITDWSNMEFKSLNNIFPKLGMDQYINYDILNKEKNDYEIIKLIEEME